MQIKSNDPETFYTPKNFYNLNAAGFGVWIVCLVIGSVFTDISSFGFRIIALSFSLMISLSLFIRNKYGRKWYNYVLIVFNACLVFINVSGYNSITYSTAFDRSRLKQNAEANELVLFSIKNQKDWWPDNNLLNQIDSANIKIREGRLWNQALLNQLSFFKDWIQSRINNDKLKDTLNTYLDALNSYDINNIDLLNFRLLDSVNKQTDSLKQLLSTQNGNTPIPNINDAIPPTIQILSPPEGALVAGSIPIQVNATDNIGIRSVTLLINGVIQGEKNAPPYIFIGSFTNRGTNTVIVRATDFNGNISVDSVHVN